MRRLITALIVTSFIAIGPAAARTRLTPEAELADAVKGRIAGEPVSCINLNSVRSVRIVDRTAIVYDAGRVVYVNRPAGAEQLDRFDTLITRMHSHRLCRPEIIRLYDSVSRFENGAVLLGDFVPYRRPDSPR